MIHRMWRIATLLIARLPVEAFAFSAPSTAKRIEFARPDPIVPEGIKLPLKRKPAKPK